MLLLMLIRARARYLDELRATVALTCLVDSALQPHRRRSGANPTRVSCVFQTLCAPAIGGTPGGLQVCVLSRDSEFSTTSSSYRSPDTADFLLNKNCVSISPPFMIMSKGEVSLGLARRSMGPRLLALPPRQVFARCCLEAKHSSMAG